MSCRKVDLKPHEVLTEVFIPATRRYEYVKEWKQAHRRDDDIAIVNAGMRVTFAQGPSGACRVLASWPHNPQHSGIGKVTWWSGASQL